MGYIVEGKQGLNLIVWPRLVEWRCFPLCVLSWYMFELYRLRLCTAFDNRLLSQAKATICCRLHSELGGLVWLGLKGPLFCWMFADQSNSSRVIFYLHETVPTNMLTPLNFYKALLYRLGNIQLFCWIGQSHLEYSSTISSSLLFLLT